MESGGLSIEDLDLDEKGAQAVDAAAHLQQRHDHQQQLDDAAHPENGAGSPRKTTTQLPNVGGRNTSSNGSSSSGSLSSKRRRSVEVGLLTSSH